MAWKQLVKPYLDDSKLIATDGAGNILYDWYEWCLAVTQAAFGIKKAKYPSAIAAWNDNPDKYAVGGMDIPIGLYVPVFYSGGKYGHIVIAYRESYEKIKVWSSPYTHKPYFDYFEGPVVATLDRIGTIYGCKYLGWTASLTDTPIVRWGSDPKPVEPKPEPKPEPEPTPAPEPEPAPEEPKKEEEVIENPPVIDIPEVEPENRGEDYREITKEEFEKALGENIKYMENVMETMENAGSEINFSATTKKIVYIVGDLLLLAGAEVSPVITMMNTDDPILFGTALTQALTMAGVGILVMFKLLKAKAGKKLLEK